MEVNQDQVAKPPTPSWLSAGKAAVVWIAIAGALAGGFALLDELRLSQPFDNLAEAMVVIVPLSVPVVAGFWHRSWRVLVLLVAVLFLVGLLLFILALGAGWAAR